MHTKALPTLLCLLSCSACTHTSNYLLTLYAEPNPRPHSFSLCHGYSCRYQAPISLSPATWQQIRTLLTTNNVSPAAERNQLAKALSLLETATAKQAGTGQDQPRSPNLRDRAGQLDCIDETVNTNTFLSMMEADGLLRWHRVSVPARRGYLVDLRWPHNSATIEEKNGQRFAVDSWPNANGEAPEIKPLAQWYREG